MKGDWTEEQKKNAGELLFRFSQEISKEMSSDDAVRSIVGKIQTLTAKGSGEEEIIEAIKEEIYQRGQVAPISRLDNFTK